MTSVSIMLNGEAGRVEVGHIEIFGLPVEEADGSLRVPATAGEVVHEWYRCDPPELLSEVNVHQIACELAQNVTAGRVNDHEWFAT